MVLLMKDLTLWADHHDGSGPFGVKLCLPSIAGLAVLSYNGVGAQYRVAEKRQPLALLVCRGWPKLTATGELKIIGRSAVGPPFQAEVIAEAKARLPSEDVLTF